MRLFHGEPLEIQEKNVVLFSSLFNFTISYNFAFSPKMAIFRKKMKKRPRGTRPRTSFGTNFGQIGLKYWSDPKMQNTKVFPFNVLQLFGNYEKTCKINILEVIWQKLKMGPKTAAILDFGLEVHQNEIFFTFFCFFGF